jgi:hypothetical protein
VSRARAAAATLLALLGLQGCAREPFARVGCDLGPAEGLALGQPIVLAFNDEIDPGSLRSATVAVVREKDGAPVDGTLRADGATVIFRARLPTVPDLSDGGFAPGEGYRIDIPGLPRMRTLRGLARGPLAEGSTRRFRIRDSAAWADPVPGGPRLVTDAARFGAGGAIDLVFSEPLDPCAVAQAAFWLIGPWSQDARPADNPRLEARLRENQVQAVIELRLKAEPPSPLAPDERYELRFEPRKLLDFAGNELWWRVAEAHPHVPLVVQEESP